MEEAIEITDALILMIRSAKNQDEVREFIDKNLHLNIFKELKKRLPK